MLILHFQVAKFVQNNLVTIKTDLDHKQVQMQNCMQLKNGMWSHKHQQNKHSSSLISNQGQTSKDKLTTGTHGSRTTCLQKPLHQRSNWFTKSTSLQFEEIQFLQMVQLETKWKDLLIMQMFTLAPLCVDKLELCQQLMQNYSE